MKLKLGYDDLKLVRPDIIYASISAFGHDTTPEYRNMAGYDIIAQAMGGIMNITGQPDGPPTRVGTSIADISSGLTLAIGILSALHKRDKTGAGQRDRYFHDGCSCFHTGECYCTLYGDRSCSGQDR
jgi:crotonobetainyl-CoA:carnitine CoA-transferase CaiB-like acyl-CoA transferase